MKSHLTNAIKKYGSQNFILHVVEECESETFAFEKEREWISYFKFMNVHLYNKSPGGYGGQKRTIPAETRLKLSITHKRRYESLELRQRLSEKMKGRFRTIEHCRKISVAKQKPIEQLTRQGLLIATFSSALEAQTITGTNRSKICECCKGRRQISNNFRWRYASK